MIDACFSRLTEIFHRFSFTPKFSYLLDEERRDESVWHATPTPAEPDRQKRNTGKSEAK